MTEMDRPEPIDRFEHRMERTYEVPATPDQVWDAIATADGISAWMVPTRLDPRVGGEVFFDFGDFGSTGVITDYAPNDRLAYEEPWPIAERADDIPAGMVAWFDSIGVSLDEVYRGLPSITPLATEFLVESESGGSCVIRVVSSSFGSGSDWEREFFAEMTSGWSGYLDQLVKHLGGSVS